MAETAVLYVRLPKVLHKALKEEAERRGQSLARATVDILEKSLLLDSIADTAALPREVEAYLAGRQLANMLAGFFEAASQDRAD